MKKQTYIAPKTEKADIVTENVLGATTFGKDEGGGSGSGEDVATKGTSFWED